MRKTLLAISALAMLTFSECKKADTPAPNSANVMFVNGCAGTNAIDVSIGGNKLNSASNLGFPKSSGYQSITAATGVSIAFALTAAGTPLISATESLTTGAHYSVFAGGLVTGTSLVFTTDDVSAPSAGKAKVRFINLSGDNLNTSCYVGTVKIDSNIGYKACTPFYEVAATTAKIAMIDQTVLTNSGQINTQQLSAGKIYTFMLTGAVLGTSSSALTLTMIPN